MLVDHLYQESQNGIIYFAQTSILQQMMVCEVHK